MRRSARSTMQRHRAAVAAIRANGGPTTVAELQRCISLGRKVTPLPVKFLPEAPPLTDFALLKVNHWQLGPTLRPGDILAFEPLSNGYPKIGVGSIVLAWHEDGEAFYPGVVHCMGVEQTMVVLFSAYDKNPLRYEDAEVVGVARALQTGRRGEYQTIAGMNGWGVDSLGAPALVAAYPAIVLYAPNGVRF